MALLKRKRAPSDAMSVVTRFVNACNRHDADGVFACLHPDFDSIQPMYPSRNFRGADQVRRNWQAIFDAEPGFRLTVLRSAAMDDTVWLELHGAGRDAEVAGVFVMGIQGDRVRWARIYSALVEPVLASAGDGSGAPLREVPPLDESAAAGQGEVVDEASIAPVVDIERSGRRRRRSSRRKEDERVEAPTAEDPVAGMATEPTPELVDEAGRVVVGEGSVVVADVLVIVEPGPGPEPEPEPEPIAEQAGPAPETELDGAGDASPGPPPEEVTTAAEVLAEPEPEPEAVGEPMPVPEVDAEADPSAAAENAPDTPPPAPAPKRRFGKKSR